MSFSAFSQKLCRKGAPALTRECTTAHARYYRNSRRGKARITMRRMSLPYTRALRALKLQNTLTRATQNSMISAKFCCAQKHLCWASRKPEASNCKRHLFGRHARVQSSAGNCESRCSTASRHLGCFAALPVCCNECYYQTESLGGCRPCRRPLRPSSCC